MFLFVHTWSKRFELQSVPEMSPNFSSPTKKGMNEWGKHAIQNVAQEIQEDKN